MRPLSLFCQFRDVYRSKVLFKKLALKGLETSLSILFIGRELATL